MQSTGLSDADEEATMGLITFGCQDQVICQVHTCELASSLQVQEAQLYKVKRPKSSKKSKKSKFEVSLQTR